MARVDHTFDDAVAKRAKHHPLHHPIQPCHPAWHRGRQQAQYFLAYSQHGLLQRLPIGLGASGSQQVEVGGVTVDLIPAQHLDQLLAGIRHRLNVKDQGVQRGLRER